MAEWLQDILLYSKEAPLLFTRFYFWAFFAIVMAVYTLISNRRIDRSAFLFIVSLFFYYKSSGFFFFILIFSTLTDFFIGKAIFKSQKKTRKQLLLALSIVVNLGLLVYFKYAYFFTDTFNTLSGQDYEVMNFLAVWANESTGTHFEVNQILLPVGISFFTFQTISYSIDVYRGLLKPVRNILDFGFYVSFFPQLVAGPIVRAAEFIPQLYQRYRLSRYEFGFGVFMILKGLVKKIFIGDYIAVNFVDRIFTDPITYTGFENLMAVIGYSLQVYVDFSGYTDIAIGVALLMGFRLPDNFNSPYKAQSVGEFWKRWHISLSSWLKDYLYIPMGGNRKGSLFTYIALTVVLIFIILLSGIWWLSLIFLSIILVLGVLAYFIPAVRKGINTNINLMITMLLGGLWHGASWQFVIWGGLNGIGLVVYKFWRRISPWENSKLWIVRPWRILITFGFITFTRIFFRSESMEVAKAMMHQIRYELLTAEGLRLIPEITIGYWKVAMMMSFGFLVHWLSTKFKATWRDRFINSPTWLMALISAIVIIVVYQSITAGMQPFIYFQF